MYIYFSVRIIIIFASLSRCERIAVNKPRNQNVKPRQEITSRALVSHILNLLPSGTLRAR